MITADLSGRRALVTGASQGLGKAIAAALLAEGAAVALCARDAGTLEDARRELAANAPEGRVIALATDVTDEDALRVLQPGDLGVRVGPGESAAALRVDGPADVASLLAAIADERAARPE